MTLYRHFRFILDQNICLLKKIRLRCLQLGQTYFSHESFTGVSIQLSNSRLMCIPDCIAYIFAVVKICMRVSIHQVMYTGIANRSYLHSLKFANCNLGIKKETETCHSHGGEPRNNETILFNLTDNCTGSSVPSSCQDTQTRRLSSEEAEEQALFTYESSCNQTGNGFSHTYGSFLKSYAGV